MASQREWPKNNDPSAVFVTPDGYLKSGNPLAGPLRMGTEPRVGPKGAGGNGNSDFGVDRITPRDFDPIGTVRERSGTIASERVKR